MRSVKMAICLAVAIPAIAATTQAVDFVLVNNEHLDVITSYSKGILFDFSTADVNIGGYITDAYVNNEATLGCGGGSIYNASSYDNSDVFISGSGSIAWLDAYNSSNVNISGGNLGNLSSYNSSTVNISGGGNYSDCSARDYSTVNISGGSIGWLGTYVNSNASILAGNLERLDASDNSNVDISGNGSIRWLRAYGTSTVNISGGSIDNDLSALDCSTVNISAGILEVLGASGNSTVNIFGYDFRVSGGANFVGNKVIGTGILIGKWFDGNSFLIEIQDNSVTANILVFPPPTPPEPSCGDSNHPYPPMDFNKDCRVDLTDFAMFTVHWLECTAPECD